MKKLFIASVIMIVMAVLVGCSGEAGKNANGTITISGSTSVGPLAEKLAMAYEKIEEVSIEVNQIGSSAGITNAINGVSQLGMSSRDLKQEEIDQEVNPIVIAHDGIVVITHANNQLKSLTTEEVKQIFTGQITNWQQVGGENKEIVVVSREDGSGSRDAFQEIIGYEASELVSNAIIASGNGNIKTTVSNNELAIGFISFEYIDESIHPLAINGVEATPENVLNKSYAISRPFLFVHKGELNEQAKQFIDYILSEEGQKIVRESGAIPIKK